MAWFTTLEPALFCNSLFHNIEKIFHNEAKVFHNIENIFHNKDKIVSKSTSSAPRHQKASLTTRPTLTRDETHLCHCQSVRNTDMVEMNCQQDDTGSWAITRVWTHLKQDWTCQNDIVRIINGLEMPSTPGEANPFVNRGGRDKDMNTFLE